MLFNLEVGQWIGPVDSPFGIHIVRIGNIVSGRIPGLAEIRKEVEREWLADFRKIAQKEILAQMQSGYSVKVELPGYREQ